MTEAAGAGVDKFMSDPAQTHTLNQIADAAWDMAVLKHAAMQKRMQDSQGASGTTEQASALSLDSDYGVIAVQHR